MEAQAKGIGRKNLEKIKKSQRARISTVEIQGRLKPRTKKYANERRTESADPARGESTERTWSEERRKRMVLLVKIRKAKVQEAIKQKDG